MEPEEAMKEAFGFIAEQRHHFRRALKQGEFDLALHHILRLTNELRVEQLSPENYYKLYAAVTWELKYLAAFVKSTPPVPPTVLLEVMQYEGNVVTRLYLLVTIASACATQVRDGLGLVREISTMIRAVQNPVRGLFLRYYLLQMFRDKLLYLGDIKAALHVLIENYGESKGLWTRLRLGDDTTWELEGRRSELEPPPPAQPGQGSNVHQVWTLDSSRHNLRFLVAANFTHMARLPGLTLELHRDIIMPEAIRTSIACEDLAGKAYLLTCFIESFPDDYHLRTLDKVLEACATVHWGVDLKVLLQDLLQRFTEHLQKAKSNDIDVFHLFHVHFQLLAARPRSPATPLSSLLVLQLELAMTVLKLHPSDASRLGAVLQDAVGLVEQRGPEPLEADCVKAVVNILAAPFTQEALVPDVLAMPHHARLMAALECAEQQTASHAILTALLTGNVKVGDAETVRRLLTLIEPVIRDKVGMLAIATEQETVAKFVHQMQHADPDVVFDMLSIAFRYLQRGGSRRIVFTMPVMVVSTLRLVRLIQEEYLARHVPKTTLETTFQFAQELCTCLSSSDPHESFRLWLLCAATAERAQRAQSAISVDHGSELGASLRCFIESAVACLETRFKDSQTQLWGLRLLVATLRDVTRLETRAAGETTLQVPDEVAYFRLISERLVLVGGRLATQRLQSLALSLCACLFWSPTCREPDQAFTCLKQALRSADGAILINAGDVDPFVEVLERADQLFGDGLAKVKPNFISSLMLLCIQHIRCDGANDADTTQAFRAIFKDIQGKKAKAFELGAPSRYAELQLDLVTKALDDPTMLHLRKSFGVEAVN